MCKTCSCPEGSRLYMAWATLLDQRRPKADTKSIRQAEKAWRDHKKSCEVCR